MKHKWFKFEKTFLIKYIYWNFYIGPNSDTGYSDIGYSDTGYSDTGYSDTGYSDTGYCDAWYFLFLFAVY
jgi:hypothetical protein